MSLISKSSAISGKRSISINTFLACPSKSFELLLRCDLSFWEEPHQEAPAWRMTGMSEETYLFQSLMSFNSWWLDFPKSIEIWYLDLASSKRLFLGVYARIDVENELNDFKSIDLWVSELAKFCSCIDAANEDRWSLTDLASLWS